MWLRAFYADITALSDPGLFQLYYSEMNEHRRKRIDRLERTDAKARSLGVSVLLNRALERCGRVELSERVSSDENGKPVISGCGSIHIGLSHSGWRAMCVISDGKCGCDVQKKGKPRMNVAKRFFAAEEYEVLMDIKNERSRTDRFFELWTQKESYVKALGTGIGTPFYSFGFDTSSDGYKRVIDNSDAGEYMVKSFDVEQEYACCVCGERRAFPCDNIEKIELF
ncbi:MAG: 4'-phosphopantetheinyl transferase family protein [Lachnospiraceae bacterium]|jgi:4'-phosphopantetheinyl transferase